MNRDQQLINSTDGWQGCAIVRSRKTIEEIKTAIAQLPPRERALLTAELVASVPEPDSLQLEAALEAGMADVAAGRVRPVSEVPELMRGWLGKS